MKASLQFVAGRLLCREVRSYLQIMRMKCDGFDFNEGPGFFERTFTVVGKLPDIQRAANDLRTWTEKVNG